MNAQRAYFIHLLASALNGVKPDEKPETVFFEDIYREAVRQNLISAIFCSVNKLYRKPDKELYDKWKTAFLRESLRSERMRSESDKLSHMLADKGIPVMLLKGCVIQQLYPEPEYRSMCDIDLMFFTDDILFRGTMEKLGYTLRTHGDCHDVYVKSHYTRIEAHCRLFTQGSAYSNLFSDIEKRSLHETYNDNLLYMTDEDAYLFLLVHAAKHYQCTGIGLRVLSDVYMTLKAHENTFNKTYLNERLQSVGLLKFKEKLECIAKAWFIGNDIGLPQAVEDEFFSGSVYGDDDKAGLRATTINGHSGRSARCAYYLSVIFISKQRLKEIYPVLNKHPWLYPLCSIHRWFDRLSDKKGSVKRIRHNASRINSETVRIQSKSFEFFGLCED